MNRELILFAFVFAASCLLCTKASKQELDSLDDQIAFRIQFKAAKEFSDINEVQQENLLKIVSAENEEYQCVLPDVIENSKKRILSYAGPTPADLLQPLYTENVCSYRIGLMELFLLEAYWYYELCHGRFLLQYHENKESRTRIEYYLGNFGKNQAETEANSFDQLSPPLRRIGDQDLPYYPVTYGHGTICDLTKKPRSTTVLYVCNEEMKNSQIFSLNEVSSCVYEAIVLTNQLCAHPAFQKPPPKEHEISCYTTKEQQSSKPMALNALEREASSQFFQEYSIFKGDSSTQSQINIFKQIFQFDANDIESGFQQLSAIIDAIKSKTKPDQNIVKETIGPKSTSSLIDSFWTGKICLHGGGGWWQFELCYGRMVSQYHEDDKGRTNVVLGVFHESEHKSWAEHHPDKVIERRPDQKIVQVSNMYTKGDLCEETGAHRKCEVRIRCRDDMAPAKISIHINEPNICSYVLTVESPLFCEPLQGMDNTYGTLTSEMPALQDHEREYEPKTFSSVPERNEAEQISEATLFEHLSDEERDSRNHEAAQKNEEEHETSSEQKKTPFRIEVLEQLVQDDDVVFRKVIMEKTDEKYQSHEASEARFEENKANTGDEENDENKQSQEKIEL